MKQGVAGKSDMFFGTVVENSAGRVTGGGDDGECVGAERDLVIVVEVFPNGRKLLIEFHSDDSLGLLSEIIHQRFVVTMHFGLQTKLLEDRVVAKVMIEMCVCDQQMLRYQLIVTNVLHDGGALFGIKSAAVNDDTFARFIIDHVAILLQHIADKSLDVQHFVQIGT